MLVLKNAYKNAYFTGCYRGSGPPGKRVSSTIYGNIEKPMLMI
jgi:hypothetical protein